MADMWGDLLDVQDEAAAKKKSEAELKQFTVDEVRPDEDTPITVARLLVPDASRGMSLGWGAYATRRGGGSRARWTCTHMGASTAFYLTAHYAAVCVVWVRA
jgi:hypothetical protein